MKTYRELLLSNEWKIKRDDILSRDGHSCSKCRNQNLINSLSYGVVHFETKYHWPSKINREIINLRIINYRANSLIKRDVDLKAINPKSKEIYIVYYKQEWRKISERSRIEDFYVIATKKIDFFEFLKNPVKDELISSLSAEDYYPLKGYISKETFNSIYTTNHLEGRWHKVNGLHVHHNYYQAGKNPWEYPNNALTTFCWVCHERFHKESKVPFLDKNGNKIGELTPCHRCCGAGIFPEYYHVENGICFRCRGARYEELINKV
jgi:hypothetical protein